MWCLYVFSCELVYGSWSTTSEGSFCTDFLLIFSMPVLVPSVVAQNVWIHCMQNVRCFDLKGLELSVFAGPWVGMT